MRDKSDSRNLLLGVCLQCGIDVALLIHFDVAQSLTLQFLFKVLGEDKLFRGARYCLRIFARLCVELGVV